ncbi:MAG: DUF86 domain-containing protein [Chloroflexi bacterium]|nr:DUF86 domain-containing protein [Chloroflexota bacterium]
MRADADRLRDILEAIERIERYTAHGQTAFEADELIQTWVLHHLRIIGEATRALTPAFRQRHAAVPWSEIIGMRTILVHHYFAIDIPIVWSVVERDLPELKRHVATLLAEIDQEQLS